MRVRFPPPAYLKPILYIIYSALRQKATKTEVIDELPIHKNQVFIDILRWEKVKSFLEALCITSVPIKLRSIAGY
jgi:hypothetical protein